MSEENVPPYPQIRFFRTILNKMTLSESDKSVILGMKMANATWKLIGERVGKKPDAIRKWYQRYKAIEGLPPISNLNKKILQIK